MRKCFARSTFSLAKKGLSTGKPKRGKGCRVIAITNGGVVLSFRIILQVPMKSLSGKDYRRAFY